MTVHEPLISIITVTFQAQATLQPTLDSVARQTYTAFEHLIIDGASTDRTLAMAADHRTAMQRRGISVGIFSEPDRGLYDAMNKGLHRARGRYVVFLNAGDRLHEPQTLQRVADAVRDNADGKLPAVVYGETHLVDADGQFIAPRRLKAPEKLTWTSFRHGMLVCHQSFYALREIAPDYDLRYRFSADVDWCIRLMHHAKEMGMPNVNTHAVLTDYLSEGMTTANHRASLWERFRVMGRHYGWLTTAAMHAWFLLRQQVRK